jgi:hypothetical protein
VTRPALEELLRCPDAFLYRTDFFALGLGRRAVDAIIREIGREVPGYSRPVVLVGDWLAFKERLRYRDNRVRPS